jgi:aspartate racemase
MKKIGLIGGMSWQSTAAYYRTINEGVARRLGGLHSAELLLYSVDFEPMERMQQAGNWSGIGLKLGFAGLALQAAGADFLVLCTNTMHECASTIEMASKLPLLHIADCTAEAIKKAGYKRVGLLGTEYTMTRDFYRGRLARPHGLEVIIPSDGDRNFIHRVIFDELCNGQLLDASRARFVGIVSALKSVGAEAVILGCTEIGLLVGENDLPLPLFDTTQIHAEAAVVLALKKQS